VTLSDHKGNTASYPRNTVVNLPAERPVFCPPLAYALVPHGLTLTALEGIALILAIKGISLSKALWISVERAEDGELTTTVFNMGTTRVRIAKGECVSELVYLAGPGPLLVEKAPAVEVS